jgi:TP901 family phage tail tape measure protein
MSVRAAELKAYIGAETAELRRKLAEADKDVERFASETSKKLDELDKKGGKSLKNLGKQGVDSIEAMIARGKKLQQFGTDLSSVGRSFTMGVTLPIVAGGGAALKAAIDFENAFTGVERTVGGTARELAVLERGFRDLATKGKIPETAENLANIGKTVGQLGVAREGILEFTKVVAMLGATTDVAGEAGATSLAQFSNVMQIGAKDVDRLGSTLVALGLKGASTERQILEMAQRIAGAGKTVGARSSDVLALANALTSVGIEAEMGGSAASRVIIKLGKAVADGGKDLKQFANVAGVSAEEFSKAFQDRPIVAFQMFVEGLKRLKDEGKNVFGILEAMELQDIRLQDSLLRAANAGDILRESLDVGGKAWDENTELQRQFEIRSKSTANQLKLLRNEVMDVAIDAGKELIPALREAMPAFRDVIGSVRDLVKWFSGLPAPMQGAIIKTTLLAAAFGPLLSAGGSVISMIGTMITVAGKLELAYVAAAGGATGFAGALNVLKAAAVAAFGALVAVLGVAASVAAIAGPALLAMDASVRTHEANTAEALARAGSMRVKVLENSSKVIEEDIKKGDAAMLATYKNLGKIPEFDKLFRARLAEQGKVLTQDGRIIKATTAKQEEMLKAARKQEQQTREMQELIGRIAGKGGGGGLKGQIVPYNPGLFQIEREGSTRKKKAKETESQKQTEALTDAMASLRREIALGGEASATAAMQYDVLFGQYSKAAGDVKADALKLAADRDRIESHKAYADVLKETYRSTRLAMTEDEVSRVAIERKARGLAELTKAEEAQLRAAIARKTSEEQVAEAIRRSRDATQGAKNDLSLLTDQSVENRTAIEVMGRPYEALSDRLKGVLKDLVDVRTELHQADIIAKARAASAQVGTSTELTGLPYVPEDLKKAREEVENLRLQFLEMSQAGTLAVQAVRLFKKPLEELTEEELEAARAAAKWVDEAKKFEDAKASADRAKEYIKELTLQLLELATGSRAARVEFLMLKDGLSKVDAENIVDLQNQVAKAKEWSDFIKGAAEDLTGFIEGAFVDLFEHGIKGFFSNTVRGFETMLQEIAQQYLRSVLYKLVIGRLDKAFGGGFAGAFNGLAMGGSYRAGEPIFVGERGPELLVPRSSGVVVPNRSSAGSGAGASRDVTVNLTVNYNGQGTAPGERASLSQQAVELARMTQQQLRRTG